ncbi:hypothetical protein LTR78_008158 [Recurvomyces mirabilis]|uniref:Uncharacterized protein n=1 Tax=Recurvomyces mirabilis TaxID=574656 RepID=A0AAE0WFU6_9PEZI|nr:hypothetical protein LTR78_008158 [Recurvomyces mirabilis]KAK5150643.1 hypothetical protein LTS14_009926 [Recurvomyces mirabilis]
MRMPEWDEKTVFIGKKTTSTANKPTPSTQPKPSKPALVDVHIGENFVAAVPKKLLTRFSAVANDGYFPKTPEATRVNGGPAGRPGNTDDFPGTAKLTDARNGSSNPSISFSLVGVSIQPSRTAMQSCIDWMDKNGAVTGDEILDSLFVEDPDNTPLTVLMDLYAAATCMALRPIGHHLRNEVLDRVHETIPEAAMMQHVHERFRPSTYVHEQMVKVYLNCVEQESPTEREFKAIDDLVTSDDTLAAASEQGKNRREGYWAGVERKRRALEREERDAAARQARSDWGPSSGSSGGRGRSGGSGQAVGRSQAANASPGNGRGIRGRHVPGA